MVVRCKQLQYTITPDVRTADMFYRMFRPMKFLAPLAVLVAAIPAHGQAVQLYEQFPSVIHANERYVIFSHGLIAEGEDPKPVSPKFGVYDFPAIKHALFRDGGFNLIAVQRKKGIEFEIMSVSWSRGYINC